MWVTIRFAWSDIDRSGKLQGGEKKNKCQQTLIHRSNVGVSRSNPCCVPHCNDIEPIRHCLLPSTIHRTCCWQSRLQHMAHPCARALGTPYTECKTIRVIITHCELIKANMKKCWLIRANTTTNGPGAAHNRARPIRPWSEREHRLGGHKLISFYLQIKTNA